MKLKLVATLNRTSINDPMNPVRMPHELIEIKPKIDELFRTLTVEQIREIVETGAKELEAMYGKSISKDEINQIIHESKDFRVAGRIDRLGGKSINIMAICIIVIGIISYSRGQAAFAPGSTVNEMQLGLMQQIVGLGFGATGIIAALLNKYWIGKDKE